MRLLYSVRDPDAALYADELPKLLAGADGEGAPTSRTPGRRVAPSGDRAAAGTGGRGARRRSAPGHAELEPTCYVCGPTGFVELVADLLVAAGHDTKRIRTERFGPTGGGRR